MIWCINGAAAGLERQTLAMPLAPKAPEFVELSLLAPVPMSTGSLESSDGQALGAASVPSAYLVNLGSDIQRVRSAGGLGAFCACRPSVRVGIQLVTRL